jgi:hypothetical protein
VSKVLRHCKKGRRSREEKEESGRREVSIARRKGKRRRTHPCDAIKPTASPGSTKLLMYRMCINDLK